MPSENTRPDPPVRNTDAGTGFITQEMKRLERENNQEKAMHRISLAARAQPTGETSVPQAAPSPANGTAPSAATRTTLRR
jgi:hypothetical protein